MKPDEVLSLDMAALSNRENYTFDKPLGWSEDTVFHGASVAAALLIFREGFKVTYGAWRGPQCKNIEAMYGKLPAVYTSRYWHTAKKYIGHSITTPDQ